MRENVQRDGDLVTLRVGTDRANIAGPADALPGGEDGASVEANPRESGRASVALGNCVGRNQAECAVSSQ